MTFLAMNEKVAKVDAIRIAAVGDLGRNSVPDGELG
jgi:hypothetical protein